jgi:hypothetical protein
MWAPFSEFVLILKCERGDSGLRRFCKNWVSVRLLTLGAAVKKGLRSAGLCLDLTFSDEEGLWRSMYYWE